MTAVYYKGLNKQAVVVKLMINYSNNKPYDPHGFKEEVKIKYDAVKAIAGKFPNGIVAMIKVLKAVVSALDWAGYCVLTPAKQFIWEDRGNELNKAILYLMNSKNKNAKKALCLAYFKYCRIGVMSASINSL